MAKFPESYFPRNRCYMQKKEIKIKKANKISKIWPMFCYWNPFFNRVQIKYTSLKKFGQHQDLNSGPLPWNSVTLTTIPRWFDEHGTQKTLTLLFLLFWATGIYKIRWIMLSLTFLNKKPGCFLKSNFFFTFFFVTTYHFVLLGKHLSVKDTSHTPLSSATKQVQ